MTISEAAKRLACQLVNQIDDTTFGPDECEWAPLKALARVLQERSDVAKEMQSWVMPDHYSDEYKSFAARLQALILPDDPDPVEAFLRAAGFDGKFMDYSVERAREYLAKHGLQITRKD